MSDLKAVKQNPPEGVSASPISEDNLMIWSATVFGPDDTPWEGGTFKEGEWQFKDAGSYVGTFAKDGQPIGPGKYNFLTATGDLITQEGAYEPDGEVPEAAEGEEAELPPRKWVGVPVK